MYNPPSVTKPQLLQALNEHRIVPLAAEYLGVHQQTVYRLIKRYRIRKVLSWK